ncbi:MAG: translation elongation factor-like protein [Chloroflexi bacterium]|nr:translation elongation factor-like protein [Chloroflexota bacterium]
MPERRVGVVKDYFAKIGVAGIDVEETIRVGDKIRIAGHTTELEQVVESMEIEGQQVEEATAGAKIGIKVDERCRDKDIVYMITNNEPQQEGLLSRILRWFER